MEVRFVMILKKNYICPDCKSKFRLKLALVNHRYGCHKRKKNRHFRQIKKKYWEE